MVRLSPSPDCGGGGSPPPTLGILFLREDVEGVEGPCLLADFGVGFLLRLFVLLERFYRGVSSHAKIIERLRVIEAGSSI